MTDGMVFALVLTASAVSAGWWRRATDRNPRIWMPMFVSPRWVTFRNLATFWLLVAFAGLAVIGLVGSLAGFRGG